MSTVRPRCPACGAVSCEHLALIELEAEVERLDARIAAALALHRPVESLMYPGLGCSTCGSPMVTHGNPNPDPTWPCRTVLALGGPPVTPAPVTPPHLTEPPF